jgi:hypothetical protein
MDKNFKKFLTCLEKIHDGVYALPTLYPLVAKNKM